MQHAEVAARVAVRVCFEDGDSGLLYLAIGSRILPGDTPLPVGWEMQLLAAFFPGIALEELYLSDEIGGARVRRDERCYCGLVAT